MLAGEHVTRGPHAPKSPCTLRLDSSWGAGALRLCTAVADRAACWTCRLATSQSKVCRRSWSSGSSLAASTAASSLCACTQAHLPFCMAACSQGRARMHRKVS